MGSYGDDPEPRAPPVEGPDLPGRRPAIDAGLHGQSEWWGYGKDDATLRRRQYGRVDGLGLDDRPRRLQAVGDINGDGRDDLALRSYNGDGMWNNTVLYGSGSGFKRGWGAGHPGRPWASVT